MGHLSGIRHYKIQSQDDPEVGNTKHFDNPIQAGLDCAFKNDPLVSRTPANNSHYSTQGYTALVGCGKSKAHPALKCVDFACVRTCSSLQAMEHTQADDRFAPHHAVPHALHYHKARVRRG